MGCLSSALPHHKHYVHVYQGAFLSSRLRYMNKAVSLQIDKNKTGSMLTPSQLHVQLHRGVPGGAKSVTAWITSLPVVGENNNGGF